MKLFSLREREEICDDAVKRKKAIGLRLLAGPKINLPPVSPHDRSKTKHNYAKGVSGLCREGQTPPLTPASCTQLLFIDRTRQCPCLSHSLYARFHFSTNGVSALVRTWRGRGADPSRLNRWRVPEKGRLISTAGLTHAPKDFSNSPVQCNMHAALVRQDQSTLHNLSTRRRHLPHFV